MRSWPVVLVVAFSIAQFARAADEIVADLWYAHFHKDVKAGWDHTRRTRSVENGKPVWVTETESRIIRFMDGSLLKSPMTSRSRLVEDEAGAVISYRTEVSIGLPTDPQKHEGTVKNGVISAIDGGKARTLPYPAGALGPAAVERAIVAGLAPSGEGELVRFQASDPASSDRMKWKASEKTELVDVLGRYVWMYRVEKSDSITILDVAWFGGDGHEFAGTTDLGMHRWFLTEELVAKLDAQPESLMTSRIVAPDRAIDLAAKPARAVFRLSREGGRVADVPEGVGQRIVARGANGSIEVEISAAEPPATTKVEARPYAGKEDMSLFLARTPLAQTDDARLREYAGLAVSELKNSLRCARSIEVFVKWNVKPAPANVGFATACDVISSRTGDSTEAAVLAVALARASGIPARLVAGFVYWDAASWPDSRPLGAFAFHAWAELYVGDGVWKPVDPMRVDDFKPKANIDELAGHGGFDATHVAVLRSDLATGKPVTDIVLPVLAFLDGLMIEVVEPAAPR